RGEEGNAGIAGVPACTPVQMNGLRFIHVGQVVRGQARTPALPAWSCTRAGEDACAPSLELHAGRHA
ncbi:MAG TPA: hypothetical protein VLE19_17895, partial [Pyrinomonadaceae bacterium]|nr:hypothetical protein [Pyrinomonadaceae bacterium]